MSRLWPLLRVVARLANARSSPPPAALPQVVDLYNRCISELPEERPTAAELLTGLAPLL